MLTKALLIETILAELVLAQTEPWNPPESEMRNGFRLPPQLWLGDGRAIAATDRLLQAVSEYGSILADNDISLKTAFKIQELESLLQRAFALILAEIDLDSLTYETPTKIQISVDESFNSLVDRNKREIALTLGCQLLVGDGIYPLEIGPVGFQERREWLANSVEAGRISKIAARRIAAVWQGTAQRKRTASLDFSNEKDILNSVGDFPVVCTVHTNGLSSKLTAEKGLLAARIAMTALSLMWQTPSKGLQWMALQYDGRSFSRYYILFGKISVVGSSSSRSGLPEGKSVEAGWKDSYEDYNKEFTQIGEALSAFVNPENPTDRPTLLNALFLSLWWYHQACRETSDQMATTKFAASMDALSGGHKAKGIIKFISARLGFKPDDALMKDGCTTKKVVAEIYDAGRSRLIHGTSANFSHDWAETRARAEGLGRLCILFACEWMAVNPLSDDLKAMSGS